MKLKFSSASDFYTENALTGQQERQARVYTDGSFCDDETEVMFAYALGCIFLRYYSDNTGYYFSAPYELCADAEREGAFALISEYCRLEAVPEVIVDLLPEELDMALHGAQHYDTEELGDGTVALTVYTECMLCEKIPEVVCGGVRLAELRQEYADDYEKLVKDVNLNKHFGYSYCDDMPEGRGTDFISIADEEFGRGESITFAATVDNGDERRLVGEGCLFGFDGRGRAYASFRVLPEYHRRGIGTAIFAGLRTAACLIGVKELVAEVKVANIPSLKLMSGLAEPYFDADKAIFRFALS